MPDKVAQRERDGEDVEAQQAKRSKGGRGPQTDRWQDVPSRGQKMTNQPQQTNTRPPMEKRRDVLDMEQYIQLVHNVATQVKQAIHSNDNDNNNNNVRPIFLSLSCAKGVVFKSLKEYANPI